MSLAHATEKMQRGAAAEALAAAYLTARGLTLVARNLRCKGGELDLVYLEGDVLVIVEVRQRTTAQFGGAVASVNPGKQRKLVRAARYQWQRRPDWHDRCLRFDVIGIDATPEGPPRLEWIRDAFRAGS